MIVNFNIPDPIATELNDIAQEAGYPNPKAMFIAYLRHTIRAHRANKAIVGLREAAEAKADEDTEAIA